MLLGVGVAGQACPQTPPQLGEVAAQTPEAHLSPAAQTRPQAPQLFGSLARLTIAPPGVHAVVLTLVQVLPTHCCCAPQTMPQPPQLSWSLALSVHLLLQAVVVGPPQLGTQDPAVQVVAPALPVGVWQMTPQKPQLLASVLRLAQ
jgi:hypothetical protein